MSGLALQSSRSRCPLLILHRQLGKYLLGTRESYGSIAQHIHKTVSKSMFNIYQQGAYSLRQHAELKLICGSEIFIEE